MKNKNTKYWFLLCLTPGARLYWDWKVSEMLANYRKEEKKRKKENGSR